MGVYRWYLLFSLIIFSSISHAADCPVGVHVPAGTYKPYYNVVNSSGVFDHFINLGGCEYSSPSGGAETPDGSYASYGDFVSTGKPAKEGSPVSYPQTTDTNPDDGDDNPDITPPVNPPVTPSNPDASAVRELYDQYNNCSTQLSSYPKPNFDDYDPSVDYNYNAQVRQCNSILDRLTSLIKSGSINGATENNLDFITGDGSGNFYKCRPNPYSPQDWADQGKLYPGPVLGSQLAKNREREIGFDCHIVDGKNKCDWHLNFHYGTDDGKGTSVCNSVYTSSLNPGGSGGSPAPSCPAGQFFDPRSKKCLDYSVFHCPDGQTPVFSGSDYPSCVADTGSSGGDTDSGDDSGPGLVTPSLDVPELTLAPLWNIWPSARDFTLSLPAAQCPVFNIEVFGTTHKIDTFCTLFTPDIIAIIRAICILTASIISFVIVLRS
ncbi:hypothetical protein SP215_001522 [Salmonella enterica]|nr:hypothetical protein [Salmonella enterica]